MRASAIFVILGLLALLATMTQAKFRFGEVKWEGHPRPFSKCLAARPECGTFRSLEEKQKYIDGLRVMCKKTPTDWRCKKPKKKEVVSKAGILADDEPQKTRLFTESRHAIFLRGLCKRNPEDRRCPRVSCKNCA